MADDQRFQIPEGVRDVGIFGGLLMMALGLIIGWQRSGMDAQLPPTGYKVPPKQPGLLENLGEALLSWFRGKGGGS
jgi:hypothetical protein